MVTPNRKGASKLTEVPPETKAALEAGTVESATLVEGLSIDFATLLANVFPELGDRAKTDINAKAGITKRMSMASELILQSKGTSALNALSEHQSDTVRGWGAYIISLTPHLSLKQRLTRIRKLADDSHFGVREWAWLALRPHIVESPQEAIRLLTPLTKRRSANLRRFAVESVRPRGVWCTHIGILKSCPELGLPLLEPLKDDTDRYVQNSVGNWLNDAGKSEPRWVTDLCKRWQEETNSEHTDYIVKRALRNLST